MSKFYRVYWYNRGLDSGEKSNLCYDDQLSTNLGAVKRRLVELSSNSMQHAITDTLDPVLTLDLKTLKAVVFYQKHQLTLTFGVRIYEK